MKKYIKHIVAFAIIPFFFSSCLKDDDLIGPDAEGAIHSIIEFKNVSSIKSGPNAPYALFVPGTLDPEGPDEVVINAAIRYAGINDAPEDITVTIEVVGNILTTYNTSEKTELAMLGAESFELPTTVTIKKGEREAAVPIKLKVGTFDQSKANALGLRIKDVSTKTAEVSGNFGTVIYSFPIKTIWEGVYKYTVTNNFGFIDANIGSFTEQGIRLETVGPNKVSMQYMWQTYGGSYTEYQFNADNTAVSKVIMLNGGVPNPATAVETIFIDTENKIFEVKYIGLSRGTIERFERTGD